MESEVFMFQKKVAKSLQPPPMMQQTIVRPRSAAAVTVKSVTRDEIDRYWRVKKMEEEEHLLAALKAAARIRARALSEEDYKRFEESLRDAVMRANEGKDGESNKELRVGIKDWWTKSKYAYLNQPATRNVVAWNVMICGYALNDQPHKAVACLTEMHENGIDQRHCDLGESAPSMCTAEKQIPRENTIRKGLIPHLIPEAALIDVHAKCGEVRLAELIFDQMAERSLVSRNSMITACVQNGQNIKALRLFLKLLEDGALAPDDFTISNIIPAYAELKIPASRNADTWLCDEIGIRNEQFCPELDHKYVCKKWRSAGS